MCVKEIQTPTWVGKEDTQIISDQPQLMKLTFTTDDQYCIWNMYWYFFKFCNTTLCLADIYSHSTLFGGKINPDIWFNRQLSKHLLIQFVSLHNG